MSIPSEAARADLYPGLVDLLGPQRTETLMSAISFRDDLATGRDLDLLRTVLRTEIVAVRDELRGEIVAVRDELRGEIAELRATTTRAMFAILVTILAAMAALQFAP